MTELGWPVLFPLLTAGEHVLVAAFCISKGRFELSLLAILVAAGMAFLAAVETAERNPV